MHNNCTSTNTAVGAIYKLELYTIYYCCIG